MKKTFFSHAILILLAMLLCFSFEAEAKKKDKDKDESASNDTIKPDVVSGLSFRSIGPAFASGRIADFAVNPDNTSEYYIGVASGNIWKTINNGTTFEPVFDNYGAYAIGCLAMDPKNHNVVWAGTGENNHQRALGYGDGVYKTVDGGKSWKNMGLKESRQIGMIAIHPCNTDVVFVAAEGSLWGPGGERGLYKTVDGGKNWDTVLVISEHTGVNNVLFTPGNPDIMYATSEQRRRHVHTKIGGGPESAIWKSTDGGENWKKLTKGIPSVDKGGIGIAVSPVNTDVVYAIIEAAEGKSGFFRSTDRGESWSRMSDHSSSGQYYTTIYCDPVDVDKVYSLETVTQVTLNGGKTWKRLGNNKRHVDDHALWIDPSDTKHFMIGGDGGVYESFDGGKNYFFKPNLPVTQYYRVNIDNSEPFYWVYGGTQDNASMGGPSRNINSAGVASSDWVVTLGGDGFWQAIDPTNPDIVYSEYQYGNIFRYDKKSGEKIKIKPQPVKGELTYKWNWNAPFLMSPHNPKRLYMAANKVFKSDDRGNSWQVISDDITAQIDRNTWPVMDRYWSVDGVVKDVSTSLYGTAVSLAESPVKEGLVYVGTDDGVIQVTEDAGDHWRKISAFPGVPEYTYVSDIYPSRYDENVVFAAFDNLKRDDFKPYLLKSTDKGQTWTSITGNLPEDQTVHSIIQDHQKPDLLFAGTEFGVYFSIDGGKIWTQLKSGIPTISVRDIAIQERESDLVLATFGRGFYILDDYSPLRLLSPEMLDTAAYIFPVKDALMYIQKGGRYGGGSAVYLAKNPDFGATFTYYLKETPKTLKAERKKREKDLIKDKEPIPIPTRDELRDEENEVAPHLIFTITDEDGNVMRKIYKKPGKGIRRITWNLRTASPWPVSLKNDKFDPFSSGGTGMMVMPGKYYVALSQYVRGEVTELFEPVEFNAVVLNNTTLPAEDRRELVAFQKEIMELTRTIEGADQVAQELMKRTLLIRQTLQHTPDASPVLKQRVANVEKDLDQIQWTFHGQDPAASREENWPAPPSIMERLNSILSAQWQSTSAVTQTQKDQFTLLEEEFPPVLEQLKRISEVELPGIEQEMDQIKAPWTPGRLPEWNK